MSNTSFFCRIRPPISKSSFQVKSRSKSPKSPLKQVIDQSINIFAANDKLKTTQLICCENPLKLKQIERYFSSEKQIDENTEFLLKGSEIYMFDGVFNSKSGQEKIYNELYKQSVMNALNEKNSSLFFFYGAKNSGKKFTIRGIEKNEKGILIQTVEDLLGLLNFSGNSSNEKKKLLCSIYCGYKNESIDLLSKSKIDLVNFDIYDNKISSFELRFVSEFKNLYRMAINNQKNIGILAKDPEYTENSHLLIHLSLIDHENNKKELIFVKLADSSRNSKNFIMNDLNSLGTYLINRSISNLNKWESNNDSSLTCLLHSYLLNFDINVIFLLLVNSFDHYKDNINSIKFIQSIYTHFLHSETNQKQINNENILKSEKKHKKTKEYLLQIKKLIKEIENFPDLTKNLDREQQISWLEDKIYQFKILIAEKENYPKSKENEKFKIFITKLYENELIVKDLLENFYSKKNENEENIIINKKIIQLENCVQDLEKNLIKKDQILNEYQNILNQNEEELNLYKSKDLKNEELLKNIEEKNEKIEKKINNLQKENDNFKQENNKLQYKISDLNEHIENITRNTNNQENFINELKKKLEKKQKEFDETKDKLIDCQHNIDLMEAKNKENKNKFDEKNKYLIEENEKINKKKSKIRELKNKFEQKKREFEEILKENSQNKIQYEGEIRGLKLDISSLKEEIKQFKKINEENQFLIEDLNKNLELKSQKLENSEKEIKSFKLNNHLSYQENNVTEKKNNEILKNYHKLENELNLTKKQLDQQNNRILQLEEEKNISQIQHNQEFDEFEQKLDNFVNEMNILKEKNEKLLQNEFNCQKKISQLENENDSLKLENQKIKLKREKSDIPDYFNEKPLKIEEKTINFKKDYSKKDVSHRDIKQKLRKLEDIQKMLSTHKSKTIDLDLEISDSSVD